MTNAKDLRLEARFVKPVRGFVEVLALTLLAAFLLMCGVSVSAQDVRNTIPPPTGPVQPLPYSHKTHLALGMQCATCHTNPDPGVLMTFPKTAACMQCHNTVAKDKPSIKKLADYNESGETIPWVRVYKVVPGVEWSHRKHVQAGMTCEMCHGDVAKLDVMAMIKTTTSMVSCIDCHKAHNAPVTCETCHHAWKPGMVVAKTSK